MCKSELNHSVIEMVPLKVWLLNSIAEGWGRKEKQSQDLFIKKYKNWQFTQFSLQGRSAVRDI